MESEQYRKQRLTSSSGSKRLTDHHQAEEYATTRAKLMFGCYRRGDANDPDTYVAAVAMVLSRYSAEVVQAITDPFSGLPSRKSESGWTGLPDVADVKAACEAEAARRDRIKTLGTRRPMPQIEGPKRNRGNVLVRSNVPQYQAMLERTKTAGPLDWRWDEKEPSAIWVPYPWLGEGARAAPAFTTFTEEQLRAMYAPRKPEEDLEGVPFE